MRIRYTVAFTALVGAPAIAADLNVGIEIPRLSVAEYHRPYVALWVERADQSVAANLAVWYALKMRNNEGTKWLKDMRQWWRRSGRGLEMPVDGVSSATRPVGKHKLSFSDASPPLGKLAPGEYKLFVEASREVGGRELLQIPFQWPPTKAQTLQAQGNSELGEIVLELKP
ncbi:MAG: DUF2271 domain-containing protein [Burkholderiaceae bacterium]